MVHAMQILQVPSCRLEMHVVIALSWAILAEEGLNVSASCQYTADSSGMGLLL